MSIEITIGGRLFGPIQFDRRTVRLDGYLQRVIAESGVDTLLPEPDETEQAYLLRLYARLMHSGKGCALLGGYLLPMGVTERTWTPEIAAETAAFLEQCDTEADRSEVASLMTECVLFFFQQRLGWLMRFLNCLHSPETMSENPQKSPSRGRLLWNSWRTRISTWRSACGHGR